MTAPSFTQYLQIPNRSTIINNLDMGGYPNTSLLSGYDLVVDCTDTGEFDTSYLVKDGERVSFPMFDDERPQYARSLSDVCSIADTVIDRIERDQRVLVHCAAGLNRSGLVVGITLRRMGYTASSAINTIRSRRSEFALYNRLFERMVRQYHQPAHGKTEQATTPDQQQLCLS